jgi:plasmid stability protein
MAVLNIRNLPEKVHSQLRIRAARAGRSMEAEARAILAAACLVDEPVLDAEALQQWVDALYAQQRPDGVVDELIAERRREAVGE